MKKLFTSLLALTLLANIANAETIKDYNRVGINYNNTTPWSADMKGLNGFGLYYNHGFHITDRPMFIEVGGGFNFLFHQDVDGNKGLKEIYSTSLISLEVPVNYVYRFNLGDNFTISPYAGINARLHLYGVDQYITKGGNLKTTYTLNMFDKVDMGNKPFNRFQLGWQIGVGVQYKPYYLGLAYGTDITPLNSHNPKVYSGTFKINIGYTF